MTLFGIGAQEMVLIGLLALLVFGPGKLPEIARDLGKFVGKARASADEFKSELTLREDRGDSRKTPKKIPGRGPGSRRKEGSPETIGVDREESKLLTKSEPQDTNAKEQL